MKLWLLRPRDDLGKDNPWDPWYDKPFGYVVRAETKEDARKVADADSRGDMRKGVWLEMKYSTCVELMSTGPAEIIIKDFASA